jgi:hypothetical protein
MIIRGVKEAPTFIARVMRLHKPAGYVSNLDRIHWDFGSGITFTH